jgi:hypothetical protein
MLDALHRMPPGQRHALAEALEVLVRDAGFAGEPVSMFFEDDGPGDGG